MIRSSLQARKANATSTKKTLLGFGFEQQCPSGTVLIKRSTKEDLVRAKKYAHRSHPADYTNAAADKTYVAVVVFNTTTKKYYGAAARMEVFHNLKDILPNQISAAQVNLIKGQKGPRNYLNTIQFGWHVDPQLYGNYDTHFFTYRTTNGYQNGCYNKCGFFVQVSRTIAPGMVLSNNVTALTLSVNRVDSNGDWLLRYREHDDGVYEDVGFWPKEAFTNMADITMVLMGGIVFSPANEPSPPMGNGFQPENARGARFTHVTLRDGNGNFYGPNESKVSTFRSVAEYWVGKNGDQGDDQYMFEYGGPGGYKI